jgi:hypothetical protein
MYLPRKNLGPSCIVFTYKSVPLNCQKKILENLYIVIYAYTFIVHLISISYEPGIASILISFYTYLLKSYILSYWLYRDNP